MAGASALKFGARSQGTTLLEALVAVTIVLLVLLSLLGTIAYGLQGIENSDGHQKAVYHCQRIFELIRGRRLSQTAWDPPSRAVGFSDAVNDRNALDAAPFDNDLPSGTRYTRRIVTKQISADITDYQFKLYEVEVTVFWKVKSRENHFKLTGIYRAP